MSESSADVPKETPQCPKCDRPMLKRTARRGANAGNEFWGCSEFPQCRGMLPYEAAAETSEEDESRVAAAYAGPASPEGSTGSGSDGKSEGLLTKVARTVDKGWRWYLESDEPDATGRWDADHRRRVLSYIYKRDGGRCGLCAGDTKMQGAQIEHIVPKVFAVFDVRKGKAEPGTRYRSRLHKLDNLQVAHTYCNKRKGNTPQVKRWRHPDMPPLPVADTDGGQEFVLPWKPATTSKR